MNRKIKNFLSQPRWQLRIMALILALLSFIRNDVVIGILSGFMGGWSFAFKEKDKI